MRYTKEEKEEIIKIVDQSDISANRTLKELGINKRTFYNWYNKYLKYGSEGLEPKNKGRKQTWNRIPDELRQEVIDIAEEFEYLSARELAYHIIDNHKWYISESSVYRILKKAGLIYAPAHIVLSAADEFERKTSCINEMWQTDFSFFKIVGWGWYYLSTVMDDYSRYIVAWDLRPGMTSKDAMPSVEKAMQVAGLGKENAPALLSDNGKCYISSEFRSFLKKRGIKQINGRPCHPQTQGKIERYHRSIKNVIRLENYYSPEQLKKAIADFVDYYNNERYHESLNNLTPADVYFDRDKDILKERQKIKKKTMRLRREFNNFKNAI